MNFLIIPLGLIIWAFIGYVSILVAFKIAKWNIDDIFEHDLILWVSLGGLITALMFILIGIIYLLVIIPYRILFPDKD